MGERTSLHEAAEYNSKDVAELLIRSGADDNAKDAVSGYSHPIIFHHMIRILYCRLEQSYKNNRMICCLCLTDIFVEESHLCIKEWSNSFASGSIEEWNCRC